MANDKNFFDDDEFEEEQIDKNSKHNDNYHHNHEKHFSEVQGELRKSYQFRALMRKNAALQSRQLCTNCCQLAVPLILVAMVGLIQILYNYYVVDSFVPGVHVMTYPQLITYNNGSILPNTRNYTSNWEYYTLWETGFNQTVIGNLTITGEGNSGLLGEITQLQNTSNTVNTTLTPWYQPWDSFDDMNSYLESQKNYWVQRQLANQRFPRCLTCPQAANVFNDVQSTPDSVSIDYQILIDTQLGVSPIVTWHTMMNMIDTAFVRYVTNNANFTIATYIQQLPYIQQVPEFDIASFLSVLLYPFAISFILPVYVNSIVLEKQERLREMMKMMGLKMVYYWITNYIWDLILYILVVLVLIITSLAFSLRMFTQTNFLILILMFIGWGNAQIALSFLLSTFFKRARSATVVSYLLVIASVIISYVLNATVFKEDQTYIFFLLYPAFACYRAIYLIGVGCSVLQCPTLSDLVWGSQMLNVIIFLYIDTVLYFVVGLYLDAVLPSEFGVPKHPLFPIHYLHKLYKRLRKIEDDDDEQVTLLNVTANQNLDDTDEDKDVKEERRRIYENNIPQDSPVVIMNLRKQYPGSDKVAVKDICFHIEKGECFGLLGPNGAGKTTTISMLTGLFPPSSGTARIAGFDIRKQMDLIHRVMSVCPQFDTLWMELTCLETVLFYARLKGVDSSNEKKDSLETLTKVGLEQYSNRKAKELSGGMRRRLSIAIALIGDPRVVFLDEPTTGLDPETRRHLWEVMLEITKGRSVILTTHSMEEADILSSRIGIMSKGELRCIGRQLHLKNRYGSGYSLHVNTHPSNEDNVVNFIHQIFPGARLNERLAGNVDFQIPAEQLKVSELFEQMEFNKDRVGIQDWGISQTTIEDVFMKIVKDDEKEEYLATN